MYKELSIDLETRSDVDIKVGVYKYVESPVFKILLMSYAFDDEPVKSIDLTKREIPAEVLKALSNAAITKTAWQAIFEITCLEKHLGVELDVSQWKCTQIGATMVGLPASLAQAGMALHLDTTKDAAGKKLIILFCKPVKEKVKKGQLPLFTKELIWNDSSTHPEKWQSFKGYCNKDVEQERKIKNKIRPLIDKVFTEDERFIWWVDHKINKYGVRVDQAFAKRCIKLAEQQKKICMQEAIQLTNLINPNSRNQIKGWLEAAIGESIESLNKKFIPGLKAKAMDEKTERVLQLREELSKSSIKKFNSMIASVLENGRLCGLHKYFGAAKTGRWSSTGVQIHNLKRNDDELDIDLARQIIMDHGLDEMEMAFEKGPNEILSQMIRPAFISKPGHSFIMSDFSSIEAIITACLAGEQWRIDIFNGHGRIYEASASQMFKVPLESISFVKNGKTVKGKNYGTRAKGKIGELALGFGGGLDALKRMGGEQMGLSDEEMIGIVKLWRKTSPKIPIYWKEIQECAIAAVKNRGKEIKHKSNVSYKVENNILWCKLPSGRFIAYREPKIEERYVKKLDAYKETLTYIGMEQTRQQIIRLSTYGGKLVENIVQGTARDLLAGALVRSYKAGYKVVIHVHDEIVPEVSDKNIASDVIKINKIMAERPLWAKDWPIRAVSTVSKYYKK